jgi:hypothetical protein
MKKMILIVLGLLSFSSLSVADEGFMSFGIGVFNSAKKSRGETKVFNMGYRPDLIDGIYWQHKIGFWGDGAHDGRKSSLYVSTGPGLKVDLAPVEIRAGYGIGAISTPDAYLGGHIPQFQGELYIGLRDRRGNGIGLQYEHISSAGLVMPNKGRDFLVIQLSQKW